jgi:hypothetical protein
MKLSVVRQAVRLPLMFLALDIPSLTMPDSVFMYFFSPETIKNSQIYKAARPPTIAAPRIPQPAVCMGTAAPVDVAAADADAAGVDADEGEEEP